jgi:hypothetical protein
LLLEIWSRENASYVRKILLKEQIPFMRPEFFFNVLKAVKQHFSSPFKSEIQFHCTGYKGSSVRQEIIKPLMHLRFQNKIALTLYNKKIF